MPWQRAGYRKSSLHFYVPEATRDYQLKVRAAASIARVLPLFAPVALELRIYLPDWRVRDDDNIEKTIRDALQANRKRKWRAIAFVNDNVVRRVLRVVDVDPESPRVEVMLEGSEVAGKSPAGHFFVAGKSPPNNSRNQKPRRVTGCPVPNVIRHHGVDPAL